MTTSNESAEVKWVKKSDALEMVTFPLTRKRLENMLTGKNAVSCFAFTKEPFQIVAEQDLSVGKA